jgi:hypothetical protein
MNDLRPGQSNQLGDAEGAVNGDPKQVLVSAGARVPDHELHALNCEN